MSSLVDDRTGLAEGCDADWQETPHLLRQERSINMVRRALSPDDRIEQGFRLSVPRDLHVIWKLCLGTSVGWHESIIWRGNGYLLGTEST